MKVMFIAYYFPPYGGGPSVRVHNFVRNLGRAGVEVVVLTVDDRYYEDGYHDPVLLDCYEGSTKICRTGMYFGERLKRAKSEALRGNGSRRSSAFNWKRAVKRVLLPDEQVFWAAHGLPQGLRVAKDEQPDVIVSTAPPFSAHLLGAMLAGRTGIPLVLDYRDLWTQSDSYGANPLARDLEARIVRRASRVIVTNEVARDRIAQRFRVAAAKIEILENGFDACELEHARRAHRRAEKESLVFSHIGSLTARRTPEYFFAALLVARKILKQPLKVRFIGYAPEQHRDLASRMGLADSVEFCAPVSREKALEAMCNETDVLLLFQRISEGGDTAIPGKVYEYLASGNPILAMDEGEGATSQFLASVGARPACGYTDVGAISRRIVELATNYPQEVQSSQNVAATMSRYDRTEQARRLEAMLLTLAQPR